MLERANEKKKAWPSFFYIAFWQLCLSSTDLDLEVRHEVVLVLLEVAAAAAAAALHCDHVASPIVQLELARPMPAITQLKKN